MKFARRLLRLWLRDFSCLSIITVMLLSTGVAQRDKNAEVTWPDLKYVLVLQIQEGVGSDSSLIRVEPVNQDKAGLGRCMVANETHSWIHVRITDANFVYFEGTLAPSIAEEVHADGTRAMGWPVKILEIALPPRGYELEVTGEGFRGAKMAFSAKSSKSYDFSVKAANP